MLREDKKVRDSKEVNVCNLKRELLTFDARVAAIKSTLAEYKGMHEVQEAENFISSDQIRSIT